jgi:hypothetical protein
MSEFDNNASSVAMLPPEQLSGELKLIITQAGSWRIDYLEPLEDGGYTGASIACIAKVVMGPSPLLDKNFGLRINRRIAKSKSKDCAVLGENSCNIDLHLEDGDFALVAALLAAGLLDKNVVIEVPFYPKPKFRKNPDLLLADIDKFSIQRIFLS